MIEKQLEGWQGKFLSLRGRIVLLNSVLSAVPLYQASVYRIPRWVIAQINKFRKKFLWGGVGCKRKSYNLVKSGQVCRPKKQGGLGVSNLLHMNMTLLMKQWWMLITMPKKAVCNKYGIWNNRESYGTNSSQFWKGLQEIKDIF